MRRNAVEYDVLLQPVPARRRRGDPGSDNARLVRQRSQRVVADVNFAVERTAGSYSFCYGRSLRALDPGGLKWHRGR